jgi:hypothetical protein
MGRNYRSSAEHLRKVALGLPESTEQLTWEVHPTFRVRSKIFAILGEDGATATVKASKDEQAALIAQSPEAYRIAAHVGRHGWVEVALARADADQVEELLADAWRSIAPKRLVAEFDAAEA